MEKIKGTLIILVMLGIGVGIFYWIKEKTIPEELTETSNVEEKNNNLLKKCIVLKSSELSEIECEDNVIYEIKLEGNYVVGDFLTIEYKEDFKEENLIKVIKSTSFDKEEFEKEAIFKEYYNKALEKLNTMTMDEKIGQILLARVSDVNQMKDLKTYQFGGYLLFKRDFQGKTKEEVIKMIKTYQENANIPLLIAADEEGGIVSRISSNKNLVSSPFKSPRTLYLEGGFEKIKEDTIEKSKILSELGINLNLAPVVDVSTSEKDYMYKRSLGESSEITSEFAKTVIEASKEGKVSYTLKHFPGYGNNSDTHIGLSYDTRSLDSIKEIDLPPFEAGIKALAEAVLVSHNIVSSIDKDNPSSLSKEIHNLLRKDLNFTGVIITDDLSMGAIEDYYKDGAVVNAINSGNDLLIVTDYKNSIEEIKNALKKNVLSETIINKRVLRILSWKYYKGLITE